ncbi:Zn-ribbon domain-containing OB-fold protein [Rhodococcus sp. NPDC003318]|uniref:Zn-ribbon domain-containing OB-fold protein n=1 Tax=Rhodococcus sp. NPDC003318 TaxID=3364503 RepID=UPI00367C130C
MSVEAITRPLEAEPHPVAPLAPPTFMLRSCGPCTTLSGPDAWVCPTCGGPLDSVPSTGRGTVLSWAQLDPATAAAPHAQPGLDPLTIAIVELDEGPWIYATIEGDEPGPARGRARVAFLREPVVGRFPAFGLS